MTLFRGKENAKFRLAMVLLAWPTGHRHYGYDLSKEARLWHHRLYPLLDDLLTRGWVSDGWDDDPEADLPRRYYVLTENGRDSLLADKWFRHA